VLWQRTTRRDDWCSQGQTSEEALYITDNHVCRLTLINARHQLNSGSILFYLCAVFFSSLLVLFVFTNYCIFVLLTSDYGEIKLYILMPGWVFGTQYRLVHCVVLQFYGCEFTRVKTAKRRKITIKYKVKINS